MGSLDVNKLLALVDQANRLQQEIHELFGKPGTNGHSPADAALMDYILNHYEKHHPNPIICETDLQGVITYVNDEFVRYSKYEREELVGQNISIIKSSVMDDDPATKGIFKDLWNNISAGRTWAGEICNRAKDYETYWVDLMVMPILGADGKPLRYWSMAFDISTRNKKEEELKAKNHEMKQSLDYAKRIQKTILPEKDAVEWMEKDWFVIYKPKDIVSGDFYWFTHNLRTAFLAVVDCTGHGVPGAFMSLIGFNLLNQIVNEMKIEHPGEILTELHKKVRSTLKQDAADSKSRDGMDVCLVAIDKFDDSFEFAGAFRPLYLFRAGSGELEEIKPDKCSIGGEQMEEERKFKNHVFEVAEGDAIYMVSDGYTDQFGGPEAEKKKFSTKRLKQMILDLNQKQDKMSVQRAMFNREWIEWKGDDEQIDDVTLIGVKF